MGKIRVKTIGDETLEKKDAKKAEARAAAKRAKEEAASNAVKEEVSKDATSNVADANAEEKTLSEAKSASGGKPKKKEKFLKSKKQTHSSAYLTVVEKVDKNKTYKLADALTLLAEMKLAKFDETVELHINTTETGVSGTVILPHGTGKTIRVAILDQSSDPKHVEEVIKNIEAGNIDFDVLIATPDAMPKLAKVARILGPRGLMPNPKNGTVTPKPADAAKKFEGGQMHFKTESKSPIIHLIVGKLSFGEAKLTENIKTALSAVNVKKIKNATLKSTMSPGLKLDIASI